MYTYRTAWTLAAILLLVAVVMAASHHGRSNRTYAPTQSTHTIRTPEEAYAIWQKDGVRGRTLILFDQYPHNMGYYSYNGTPRLTQTNLIEYAIFQNIIRKIYFIVPEMEWTEFRQKRFIRPIREATETTKGLYLYNQSGIPIIAVTPASLPHIAEPALVYVNTRMFGLEQTKELLAKKMITTDILVSLERPTDE